MFPKTNPNFDIKGTSKTHLLGMPESYLDEIFFETEATAFNVPEKNDGHQHDQNLPRRYKSNKKPRKRGKEFKRRDSGYPMPGSSGQDSGPMLSPVFEDVPGSFEYENAGFSIQNESKSTRDDLPYQIPRPEVYGLPSKPQPQNNLNKSCVYNRPIAPHYEPCPSNMNISEYIGDKSHPGKLVFSSDYIFTNEFENPERSIPSTPPTVYPSEHSVWPGNTSSSDKMKHTERIRRHDRDDKVR